MTPRGVGALALVASLAACDRTQRESTREPAPPSIPPSSTPSASAPAVQASDHAAPAAPRPEREFEPWPAGYVPPEVWETQRVLFEGVVETWSLRFRSPAHFNGCWPTMGCPCDGNAWGLTGELELVRERPGAPTERLDLAALCPHGAQIPGFAPSPVDDTFRDPKGVLEKVVKRPHVKVMHLEDYDHDGRATEFVFETGYYACGQHPSVLVGLSRQDPHLHAIGTVQAPAEPLELTYRAEWERIRTARGPTVEVSQHDCGDHGGSRVTLTLGLDPAAGFRVVEVDDWEMDTSGDRPRCTVRVPRR